jgi:hypothetical protein
MDTTQNHTPGPWRWLSGAETGREHSNCYLSSLVGPLYDASVKSHERRQEICNFGNDETYYPMEGMEPSDADKLLIAAAPDLLAACLRVLNPTDEGPRMEDIVSAAVAKALGQNQ